MTPPAKSLVQSWRGADDRVTEALRARGQRVTSQRLVIHRVLRELGRHASAEEVSAAVHDRLPGVSLPTVYATLDLFDRLGLVRRVRVGGGAALYDPGGDHHHTVCDRCGRVEDLEAAVDLDRAVAAAGLTGFAPEGAQVVLTGLCGQCRAAA